MEAVHMRPTANQNKKGLERGPKSRGSRHRHPEMILPYRYKKPWSHDANTRDYAES